MGFAANLMLVLIAVFVSCQSNYTQRKEVDTVQDAVDYSPDYGEIMYKNNCASCHRATFQFLSAPGLRTIDKDSALSFYDGVFRKDSVWKFHQEIPVYREQWQAIMDWVGPR